MHERETAPEAAENTFFNKLHELRSKSTNSPKMKTTYVKSKGSKNRRNRAIKLNL